MTRPFEDDAREWLETDGLGGFASGTVSGVRTRRYHALLLVATTPPTGRVVLVNGFDAWLDTADGPVALSSQRYAPDVVAPDGASRIEQFTADPWPTWQFVAPDGARVQQEIVVPRAGQAASGGASPMGEVVVRWRLLAGPHGASPRGASVRLMVRPFVSGRDYHATHHENGALSTDARVGDGTVMWRPYADLPAVRSRSTARYSHQPDWYRQFLYTAERERGLDDREDLWTPGTLAFELGAADAVWILDAHRGDAATPAGDVRAAADAVFAAEAARRHAFPNRLARAADAYIVGRGTGRTIVAGYPWFTDWGRDTFIALRGLCLGTGRADIARAILIEWCGVVSDGMLPNRFPDGGDAPEYNAVDASLWFVTAAGDLLDATERGELMLDDADRVRLRDAVAAIVEGHLRGTRYGIRADAEGLLACGAPGVQLTWMDAKVGDHVITPRTGKPVEVQALWLHALACAARIEAAVDPASRRATRWLDLAARGRARFAEVFWNEATGCLYDVVDVDHEPGRRDGTIRPNQIFAVGGVGDPLITGARARSLVDVIEARLWTPMGLRSLAPGEPGYAGHYQGPPESRDGVYHQGTVWPWLIGAFVEAWLRVHPDEPDAATIARTRFLAPLLAHLDEAGLGHISEIADADAPYTPRGCPFQAWSLGELIRAEHAVATRAAAAGRPVSTVRRRNRATLARA
ncbi:MAG: amylo-alpha-1,6-glucosidase [Vicinamibacteraceae bacterium]